MLKGLSSTLRACGVSLDKAGALMEAAPYVEKRESRAPAPAPAAHGLT